MGMRMHTQAMHTHTYYMRMHTQACACMLGFQKLCKESFLHLNLVWNESHIVWEPPQTPIFQLYKAIKGTFSKEDEIVGKTHKIC